MEPINLPIEVSPQKPETFVYSSADSVNNMIDLQGNQPMKIWEASQGVINAEYDLDELKASYDNHYKDMYLTAVGKTVADKDAIICKDELIVIKAEKVQEAKRTLAIAKAIYKLRCDEFDAMKSQTILLNQMLRNQL